MRGCLLSAPGEGFERSFFSWKRSSECKQNVSTCELQWVVRCWRHERSGTHAQAQIRRNRGERTRTDGDTDSELMASELRLGLSEN